MTDCLKKKSSACHYSFSHEAYKSFAGFLRVIFIDKLLQYTLKDLSRDPW